MASRVCLLITLAFATFIYAKGQDVVPAIAMVCGKNTQHRDLTTGDWVSDSTGNKDCMTDPSEMRGYCQQVYPSLTISDVLQEDTRVKVSSWCALGNSGPKCKGHAHNVAPVRCVVESASPPALTVPPQCSLEHVNNQSLCKGYSYWAAKADEKCQAMSMMRQGNFNPVRACTSPSTWHGAQFVCCPNTKVVAKKVIPQSSLLDPVCSQPKKVGFCRAAFQRWFHNTESGKCERFIYGGCGKNDNNFATEEDCEDKCVTDVLPADPVLAVPLFTGVGPVILDENNKPAKQVIAEPEPQIYQLESEEPQNEDLYFNAGLDPDNEHDLYMKGRMNELKQHQAKVAKATASWDQAKSQLIQSGASQVKKDKVDEDFHNTVNDLTNEHRQKQKQLLSVHTARVDAISVATRQSKLHDFLQELNAPSPIPSHVLRTLRHYIKSELRNQQHIKHHIDLATDDDTPVDIAESTPKLQAQYSAVQERINNAFQLIHQHPDVESEIQDELDAIMEEVLPTETQDITDNDTDSSLDNEEPIIIDEGGLPAENTENREEIDDEDYYEDDYNDDNDIDGVDVANDDDDEGIEEVDEVSDDYEIDGLDEADDDDDEIDGVEEANDDDDENLSEDIWDEDDDEATDDLIGKIFEDEEPYLRKLNEPAMVFDNDATDDKFVHSYSELTWLRWLGVFAAGLGLLLVIVAVVRYYQIRSYRAHRFTRIQADDHLTAEERQLLQMQQNGYENPTFKFFEKQQIA